MRASADGCRSYVRKQTWTASVGLAGLAGSGSRLAGCRQPLSLSVDSSDRADSHLVLCVSRREDFCLLCLLADRAKSSFLCFLKNKLTEIKRHTVTKVHLFQETGRHHANVASPLAAELMCKVGTLCLRKQCLCSDI